MAINETTFDNAYFFDSLMYLTDIDDTKSKNVNELLLSLTNKKKIKESNREKVEYLRQIIKENPELGETKILDKSYVNGVEAGVVTSLGSDKATDDYIQACAFKTPDGDLYVSYRGTGNGRWGDNRDGFFYSETAMQKDAKGYFDYVMDKYSREIDGDIYVTGHSKGGNEAQYVTMTSKYRDEIKQCISYDGQGFSEAAIEDFKKNNPDGEYERLLDKMYSVNSENDFVHPLINPIISKENTYYLNNNPDVFMTHDLKAIGDEHGHLNWKRDSNGNIINGKPGPVAILVEEIMVSLRKLPLEKQYECAVVIMGICERYIGSGKWVGMDGKSISVEDIDTFITYGIPTIYFALTAEGMTVNEKIIASAHEKYGLTGLIGALILEVSIASVLMLSPKLPMRNMIIISNFVDSVAETVDKIKKLYRNADKWVDNILEYLSNRIKSVKKWLFYKSPGYADATSNPNVIVDTDLMRQYGNRLKSASSRAKSLDWKMNKLYANLFIDWSSIFEVGSLLRAGMILDYAGRLDSCADYLFTTAADFYKVEKNIINK